MARIERKPAERVAIAGLIVSAVGGLLCLAVTVVSGSSSAWVLTWQLLVGTLVWVITLMRLRQTRLAEEETAEWERLEAERAQGGARGRLFDEDEIQAFSARNRLRILDKYITPIFSLGIALGLIAVVVLTLLSHVIENIEIHSSQLVFLLLFAFGGVTFVFFLLSRYAAGMSRQTEWRPLRAAAGYMMANTIFAACTVAAFATTQLGFGRPDDIFAYVLLAFMGIMAIELILNFVLDFYRPRLEGVEERPAYDSRLMGLLLTPAGLFKTVSATLDYQFGFRVSQTWIYRFTEQWIAPLILFDLVTLYLLTSFVVVGAEQQGVLERRGVVQSQVLGPGIHFTLPWPIDRVYRFPANEVKLITLGHTGNELEPDKLLWTNKHYEKEFNVMVARRESDKNISEKELPVNLIVATTTIRYKITDVKKWYYSSPEPEKLLEALCEREQIKYLAGVDLFEVMSVGRAKAAANLEILMQKAADKVATQQGAGLGVEILAVGVEGMHPPVEPDLPEAFHSVIDALTQTETTQLQAQQTREQTLGSAVSAAATVKLRAQSYYATRVAVAEAEAKRFDAQNTAYGTSAEVFKAREYFSTLEKGLQDPSAVTEEQRDHIPRKIVIGMKNMDQHIRLNLEDPIASDLEQLQFTKP